MPPFVGVAVKVTRSPAQAGFLEAEMETPTTELLIITIITVLLVVGLFDTQVVNDDVITHDTRSPDAGLYV